MESNVPISLSCPVSIMSSIEAWGRETVDKGGKFWAIWVDTKGIKLSLNITYFYCGIIIHIIFEHFDYYMFFNSSCTIILLYMPLRPFPFRLY